MRVTAGSLTPDGSPIAGEEFLEPSYDMLERVVVYRLSGGRLWTGGLRYTVTLWRPDQREGAGFQAWDGAQLDDSVSFAFTVSTQPPAPTTTPAPNTGYCHACTDDTLQLGGGSVLQSSCAFGNCHGRDAEGGPAIALDLSSFERVQATALGQVAHETLTGPTSAADRNPARFGTQMPQIDPGQPGNSYLLYKIVLRDDLWDSTDDPAARQPVGGDLRPSAAELDRLRETFVIGAPMPLPPFPFTLSRARAVQAWIKAGSPPPPPGNDECPSVSTCGKGGAAGGGGSGGSSGTSGQGGAGG